METETILAELSKINGRLDEMSDCMKIIVLDIDNLKQHYMKQHDKYKSFPLDTDLDAMEQEELREAKKNASEEWKILHNLQK